MAHLRSLVIQTNMGYILFTGLIIEDQPCKNHISILTDERQFDLCHCLSVHRELVVET